MKTIIVGQGMAGSTLGLYLLSQGLDVLVVDSKERNTSTSVAAGLINPVVLKRMNLVWRAEEFMAEQNLFYQSWSIKLNGNWIQNFPVYRRFHDIREQNQWSEYSVETRFSSFLDPKIFDLPNEIDGECGMGRVLGASWFDTKEYLSDCRNYFNSINSFEEVDWDYKGNGNSMVLDKALSGPYRVVFCEGAAARFNPLFPSDALRPSKGELLRIKTREDWSLQGIVKAGVFILPIGRNELRVGATYDHHDLSKGVSEKGQSFLEDQLKKIIRVPYEVVGREWGIRPTTKDRRPILGAHPSANHVYFFNGLGSRGVLMAPLLAKELADFIFNGTALRPDVDIARFYSSALS